MCGLTVTAALHCCVHREHPVVVLRASVHAAGIFLNMFVWLAIIMQNTGWPGHLAGARATAGARLGTRGEGATGLDSEIRRRSFLRKNTPELLQKSGSDPTATAGISLDLLASRFSPPRNLSKIIPFASSLSERGSHLPLSLVAQILYERFNRL